MTVRENLLPSAMVPGLVTVEDKDGNKQNVYPIDAKEMIRSGDYTLVENGAVEAARMAATPLRSGMAAGIPSDQIVAEVSGIAGMVVTGVDAKTTEAIIDSAAGADGTGADPKAPKPAGQQARANEAKSAATQTQAEKDAAAKLGADKK